MIFSTIINCSIFDTMDDKYDTHKEFKYKTLKLIKSLCKDKGFTTKNTLFCLNNKEGQIVLSKYKGTKKHVLIFKWITLHV